ncbi:MAG: hypothetical protein HOV83_42005 [Catenulispora sp.]|nr:hypothetical protein [Catenulispora sp.]
MADTAVPEHDAVRSAAAALGDRANELAALGRAAEVPALWEEAITGLDDPAARDRLTLAYAWYQGLHGAAEHGVRLAAGLRDSAVPQVRGQIRTLVRRCRRVEPALVDQAWHAATGDELPRWAFLADEDIDAVAAWLSAASWEESKACYASSIIGLPPDDVAAVLEELLLGSSGLRRTVAAHRAVLALGAETGYQCLRGPRESAREARAAVAARDWGALRACAAIEEAHGLHLLSWTHGLTARLMAGGDLVLHPDLTAQVAARLTDLARASEPWEREQAAEDLVVLGDPALGEALR